MKLMTPHEVKLRAKEWHEFFLRRPGARSPMMEDLKAFAAYITSHDQTYRAGVLVGFNWGGAIFSVLLLICWAIWG